MDRSPAERVRDWNEFHHHMDEKRLRNQGARCMDCGVPFCHTGKLISGMASGCPVNNLIPEWNDLVYRGLWREALDRLHKTNNFPEFTGRVCPAPCEGSCVLGINAPPVTIKNIENAIIDKGWEEGWVAARAARRRAPARRSPSSAPVPPASPPPRSSTRPATRSPCFERADRPGGLLMYGIPNMKLDKREVVDAPHQADGAGRHQVRLQRQRRRERRGRSCSRKEFDAVVLCTGATKPRDLAVEGRNLKGVHFAMDFLHREHPEPARQAARRRAASTPRARTSSCIGGGDTGTDCVGTVDAPRLQEPRRSSKSCRSRRWSAPTDNPWPEWPKVYKMDYGQEEAAAKFGADPRVYLTTVKKFVGDEQPATLTGIVTVEIKWEKNDKGQFVPVEVPGTEKTQPAQLVLLAMGFLGPEQPLLEGARRRARPAHQREGRARQVHHQRPGRLRRRRLPPRPEPGRLGHQRRPRRRPRVRPLPDGPHRPALGGTATLQRAEG